MDWDEEAIERVRERLGKYGERLILEKADFADIRRVLRKHGIHEVDGIASIWGSRASRSRTRNADSVS